MLKDLPAQGISPDELLADMAAMRGGDARWREGRTWSMIYDAGDTHHALLKQAHNLFFSENYLNPMAFGSLRRMETDVVGMTARLLNGPAETVGCLTSGGTESILLAVKTARDRLRRRKPWVRRPEVVLPETAHVAFDKAAHYFNVKLRLVPAGDDWRADVKAMKRAINGRTALIVGSAPQYPHGVVDPIEALSDLALKTGIPLHVDACFGGFILPFLEKLGHPVKPWDFRLAGVSSISADLHKYGYAPKGASVLLYRNMKLMRDQFFVATRWSGGIYASATLPGSRPGGAVAAGWASMMGLGEAGYLKLAQGALDNAKRLRVGIAAEPGLELIGDPDCTIVTFRSVEPNLDTLAIGDQLEERGWHVDRQQRPASIHLSVNAANGPMLDNWLADLHDAVVAVRADPSLAKEGEAAMYGLMGRIPSRRLVGEGVRMVMEGMYGHDGAAPDLGKVGEGEDDGPLLKMMSQHGDRIRAGLDMLERVRGRR